MKSALVLLADGAEEMEAVIVVDVLRRGGVDVTAAGVGKKDKEAVECARGTRIVPDKAMDEVKDREFDAVVMPGKS